ncbi:hypothetical protein V6N13_077048 [Hibiscus sabdariffa]
MKVQRCLGLSCFSQLWWCSWGSARCCHCSIFWPHWFDFSDPSQNLCYQDHHFVLVRASSSLNQTPQVQPAGVIAKLNVRGGYGKILLTFVAMISAIGNVRNHRHRQQPNQH